MCKCVRADSGVCVCMCVEVECVCKCVRTESRVYVRKSVSGWRGVLVCKCVR